MEPLGSVVARRPTRLSAPYGPSRPGLLGDAFVGRPTMLGDLYTAGRIYGGHYGGRARSAFNVGGVGRAFVSKGAHSLMLGIPGAIAGAFAGGAVALGAGDPSSALTAGVIGAGIGGAAGTAAYFGGGSILKRAGRMGLSAAGIAGGGLEMMFGAGSKLAMKGAGFIGTGARGAVGAAPAAARWGGVMGAGAIVGGLTGGIMGGTGGSAILGTALGAMTAPRMAKMGGLTGIAMRHPLGALMGLGVLAGGLKAGSRVVGRMLESEAPGSIAGGSWNEVYGLPSNNMNTAGLVQSLHYSRR